MHIKIFTTGGTIDKIYSGRGVAYQIECPQVMEILKNSNATLDYDIESIIRKDSLDLTDDDRLLIRETVQSTMWDRIIITHGTDTIVKTAKTLGCIRDKTIVLVGAMRPAQFKNSDAEFNIGCAIVAVQLLTKGVYIVGNGHIFDPQYVQKNVELNRFEWRDDYGINRS